jgi:hypothetical protein
MLRTSPLILALETHDTNGERMKIFVTLFLIVFSGSIHAEVPQEIQGIWTPDIEKTIVLMEKNMDEIDPDYMREKYLPKLKRIITENQYIHTTGRRELKADISLKEKQGSSFVMVLSSDSTKDIEVTFIPGDNGRYIMKSRNPKDGSGNILWEKQ